jgi:hypothetical protein
VLGLLDGKLPAETEDDAPAPAPPPATTNAPGDCPASCPRCAGAQRVVARTADGAEIIAACPKPWRKR